MMLRIAAIGASGLVGRNLWPLLEQRHDLLVLGRRPSGAPRELLGPAEAWPGLLAGERLDIAVSTLGTTWKKTGSWDRFAAVDRDAVLAFARAARDAGARQFITVSSVGADPRSGNRYLRLKGEVEEALGGLGFDRLDIARPGLLLGERPGDRRVLERLAILASPLLNPLLCGRLERYRGIEASLVGQAIAALAGQTEPGRFVHTNRELKLLAG
jgi:uncharacterized protein YbjT (DUF2867 family)